MAGSSRICPPPFGYEDHIDLSYHGHKCLFGQVRFEQDDACSDSSEQDGRAFYNYNTEIEQCSVCPVVKGVGFCSGSELAFGADSAFGSGSTSWIS